MHPWGPDRAFLDRVEPEPQQVDDDARDENDDNDREQPGYGVHDAEDEIADGPEQETPERFTPCARVRKSIQDECDHHVRHNQLQPEVHEEDGPAHDETQQSRRPRCALIAQPGSRDDASRRSSTGGPSCSGVSATTPGARAGQDQPGYRLGAAFQPGAGTPGLVGLREHLLQSLNRLIRDAFQVSPAASSMSVGVRPTIARRPTPIRMPPPAARASTGPVCRRRRARRARGRERGALRGSSAHDLRPEHHDWPVEIGERGGPAGPLDGDRQ